MAASKFECVWDLILKYKFNSSNNCLNGDLNCVICKGLMVDACQSVCGCRYCYNCARAYIGDEEKYCPGGNEDCKEEHLVIGVNVTKNQILNKKISKLEVNCPNESCLCKIELIQMDDHLIRCMKQPLNCPFVPIGCINEGANKDTVVAHLSQDVLPHIQLLIGWIHNLKNEIDGLRLKMEEDSVNKENRIEFLEKELSQVRKVNRRRVKKPKAKREVVVQRDIDGVMVIVNEMRAEREVYEAEKERSINKLIKWNKLLCPNIDADFVWRIDQCSAKIGTSLYCEPFYANNYQLCLCLCIDRNDNFGLWCFIKKGYNDDRVAWPMRQSVALSIIDQCTLRAHKTEIYQYDTYDGAKSVFDRPKKDRIDYYIGSPSFIKYSAIKDTPSIIVNDCIVVSCLLTPP